MSNASDATIRCDVHGADNLPAEIGGGEAVCRAIEDAAAPEIRRLGISPAAIAVTVKVKSPFLIAATASTGGRTLPEQKVGISDRQLNRRAIEMLAKAIASDLYKLGA